MDFFEIKSFNNKLEYKEQSTIFFWGSNLGFDKGTCDYLIGIAEKLDNYNIVIINESHFIKDESKFSNSKLFYIDIPKLLFRDQVPLSTKMKISSFEKNEIDQSAVLTNAVLNFKKRNNGIGEGYAEYWCLYAFDFIRMLYEQFKYVKLTILWNKFYSLHNIVDNYCRNNNIRVSYAEFGLISGTLSLEKLGQMGESYAAISYDEFKKLPVNALELKEAKSVINYNLEKKLNRNIQPQNTLADVLDIHYIRKKKIIFYAGQNDYESGLYPYNELSQKYHSPVFSSTNEGLRYLSLLASKNNWNLIFKPHPIVYRLGDKKSYERYTNVFFVNDVEIENVIDESDLIVTILSTVSYQTLIRNKPLLTLGHTQLYKKDCCYEAYTKSNIELEIIKALSNGYTNKQKSEFTKHIAQLLKYSVYDDLKKRDLRYGRSLNDFCKTIKENIR